MTRTITTYTTTFEPWEEGQDEPTRIGTVTEEYTVDSAEEAIEMLTGKLYTIDPSSWPEWSLCTWYSAETYEHPYSGEREEVSAHLDGFTDDESRAIFAAIVKR